MYITTSKPISPASSFSALSFIDVVNLRPVEPNLRENEKAELISMAANDRTIFWTWKIVRDLSRDEVQACIDEVGF